MMVRASTHAAIIKGKNGKDEYPNATKVEHKHEHLKAGQTCRACQAGKINEYQSGVYIRITGSSPISAVIHNTEKIKMQYLW
ncbi:MAG: hypothetical protein HOP07_01355 [Bacteriovoracaceae bacterium]|nr:hypothetical protein [Bacteriovoracaceae bacterium]